MTNNFKIVYYIIKRNKFNKKLIIKKFIII